MLAAAPSIRAEASARATPDARWLVRLRWTLVGVEAVIASVWVATGQAPWMLVASALGAQVLASTASALEPPRSPGEVALTLVLDLAAMTALLALGGGSSSPFCVILLVHVTVAALVLRGWHRWSIVGLAIGAYASLFAFADEVHAAGLEGHLREMWLAFSLTSLLIAASVGRLARELELARSRADASARIVGLTTLAAGAAHEIATPLSTIKTIVGEVERELEDRDEFARIRDDLRLLRDEVARARAILDRLAGAAGELHAEAPRAVPVEALRDELDALPEEVRARVAWSAPEGIEARLPVRAVGRALCALVANAADASPADAPIDVSVRAEARSLELTVRDRGHGMDAETLARAGEPFFTTKPTGRGLGLGLFLVRSLAMHLGGEVSIDSAPNRGTTVTLRIPQLGARSNVADGLA